MTPKDIILEECAKRGVTERDIIRYDKSRPIAWHRQEIMARLRNETDLSLTKIGNLFHRDYTTVLHACRVVAKRQEKGLSTSCF